MPRLTLPQAIDELMKAEVDHIKRNQLRIEDILRHGHLGYNNYTTEDVIEAWDESFGEPLTISED